MSTPAQKLKWDDLDPVDTSAAEANAAAARSRVQSAIKEDKSATRAGTQAGMGYKLSWDDLTPVDGARQPSRVTSSGRQPLSWNQSGDTTPINRAPRSAVRPAATAGGDDGLAQPGATFAHKPTDILTYEPKAADILLGQRGPAYPEREVPWGQPLRRAPINSRSFADDASRRSGRQARVLQQGGEAREAQSQADRRRQTARGMVRLVIGAAAGVPASVIPDVVTETAADIGGGLTSVAGPIVTGESKPSIFNPIKSAVLQIPGVQRAVDNTVGRVGQVLEESGSDISEQAGAPDGVRRDIGRAVGGLIPMLAARAPFAIAAVAYDEAKGQGADELTAIEHGLTSAATVGAMGGAARAIGRAVPEAGAAAGLTRFGMRTAANAAAVPLIGAPGKALHGENTIPTDREKINAAVMGTGFAALPHPVEPSAARLTRARAQYEATRAAEESAPLYPRVNVAPTEKGVESAISTQLGTRQPLSSPRVVKRAVGQPQAESPVRLAPTSPAPSQAAQRGDFETGINKPATTTVEQSPTVASVPKESGHEGSVSNSVMATLPQPVDSVGNRAAVPQASAVTPTYAVGNHLTSPTGKTFRVEAISGDQTHVRAINRNGKPTGRTIPLRPDDVAQFRRAEAKPITVRTVSGPRTVNPETHSLSDAIAILGFDGTTQEGKDLAAYVQKRPGTINNTRLSNGEKRGIDNYLIPALRDLDYDVTDTNDLLDKVRSQKPVYSQHYYEAQAERDIQSHLATEHQAWLDDKPDSQGQSESDILFRAGKSPEFVGLLNRLHDPDATAVDEARFYEEATHRQKLPDDLATQLIETATARRNEQGRDQHGVRDVAQSATEASESGQRQKERGTVRDAAEGQGDVNGQVSVNNRAVSGLGSASSRSDSERMGTRPSADLEIRDARANGHSQPDLSTDHLSRVQSLFDALKDEARTTGRRLQDLVEDRIAQTALPGFESQALSPDDATLLRQMATRAPNRSAVQEQQQGLLDVASTLESKQAQAAAIEDAQSRGAANAPLFEGVKPEAKEPRLMANWELYEAEKAEGYEKGGSKRRNRLAAEAARKYGEKEFDDIDPARMPLHEYQNVTVSPKTPYSLGYDAVVAADDHEAFVKDALERGGIVSPEVLRDYPDLAEKYQGAAAMPSPEGPTSAAIVPEPFTWEYSERKLHVEESVPGKILVRDIEQPTRAKSFTPEEFEQQFGKTVQQAQSEAVPPHHSNFQPRDTDSGQFVEGAPDYALTPEKIKPPAGTVEGKALSLLHKESSGNFFNDPAVKRALGLNDSTSQSAVHKALQEAIGNKKPETHDASLLQAGIDGVRQWAKDNNLPPETLAKIDAAENNARFGGRADDHDVIQRYRADLARKSNELDFNPLADPERAVKSAVVLGYDLYRTAKDFGVWSGRMVRQLGEQVRPYLLGIWDGVKEFHADARGFIRYGKGQENPFYSPLEELIDEKMPRRTSADQLRGLVKSSGITADELKWSGFDEWLNGQRGPVTKDEALDFLKQNRVEVKEVAKGATSLPADKQRRLDELERNLLHNTNEQARELMALRQEAGLGQRGEGGTKYASYTLPGGENYRELLLTLPTNENAAAAMRSERVGQLTARRDGLQPLAELPEGYDVIRDRNQPEGQQYGIIPSDQAYGRPMFGRHATPQEARAAALEAINQDRQRQLQNTETQINLAKNDRSDPTAYRSSHFDEPNILAHIRFNERTDADGKRVLFLEEVQSDWHQAGRKKGYALDPARKTQLEARRAELIELGRSATPTQKQEWADIMNELQPERPDRVPQAPFSGQGWKKLAMRRVLRYAAENGFDRVAWTTGEQQAERYDLSRHIKTLAATKTGKGDWKLEIYLHNRPNDLQVQYAPSEKLEDFVGKELAEKITENGGGMYSGLDLKVGGEGMKGFYDKELPNIVNDIAKKWGAKASSTKLPGSYKKWDTISKEQVTPDVLRRAAKIADTEGKQDTAKSLREEADKVESGKPLFYSFAEPMMSVGNYVAKALDPGGREMLPAHSLDITPQMKASVMNEGQPLFGNDPPFIQKLMQRVSDAADKYEGYVAKNNERVRAKLGQGGFLRVSVPKAVYNPNQPGQITSASEAVATLRKAGLLTSVKTHLRNVLGTGAFQLTEELSRIPGSVLDLTVSSLTKQRGLTGPDIGAVGRAGYEGATKGIKEALQIMKQGTPTNNPAQVHAELNTKSPILNAYANTVFRALSAEDKIMRVYAYRRALEGRAKAEALNEKRTNPRLDVKARTQQLVSAPHAQLIAESLADAEMQTFNNDNALSTAIQEGRRVLRTKGGAGKLTDFGIDMIMPFDRTPTNIIARMLEYTPGGAVYGLGRTAYHVAAQKITGAAFTPQEQMQFARTFGRGVTGSALLTLGYALAASGHATGLYDESDKAGNRMNKETGRSPMAVKIGDKWFQIGSFSPLGNLIAIGATLFEKPDKAPALIAKEALTEQPLMRGTADVLKAVESGDRLSDKAGYMTGSFIPSAVADVAEATDDKSRKSFGFSGQIAKRIPGLRQTLPADEGVQHSRMWAVDPFHTTTEAPQSDVDAKTVHSAYRAANPLPPMTQLQKTKFDAKKEIETAIQRGDPHTSDIIKRNVDAGLVDDDEVFDIAATAHKSKKEVTRAEFKKLDLERMLDLFPTLSKEKRNECKEDLEDNWADNAMKMTPHERSVLGPRVGQALQAQ